MTRKSKFNPLRSEVLIKQLSVKDEIERKSGIIIPESALKGSLELYEGIVLAVGEYVKEIKVGMRVMFNRNSPSEVPKYCGENMIVVFENNIHGYLTYEDEEEDLTNE